MPIVVIPPFSSAYNCYVAKELKTARDRNGGFDTGRTGILLILIKIPFLIMSILRTQII